MALNNELLLCYIHNNIQNGKVGPTIIFVSGWGWELLQSDMRRAIYSKARGTQDSRDSRLDKARKLLLLTPTSESHSILSNKVYAPKLSYGHLEGKKARRATARTKKGLTEF